MAGTMLLATFSSSSGVEKSHLENALRSALAAIPGVTLSALTDIDSAYGHALSGELLDDSPASNQEILDPIPLEFQRKYRAEARLRSQG